MRVRLRERHSDAELQRIYAVPHDSSHWRDHLIRVDTTIQTAKWMGGRSVADLSCGDSRIASSLGIDTVYLGDYAPGYQFTGPIEKTIFEVPEVDLFILSETIEHVDDPDLVLRLIRNRAKMLVLSTPDGEGITSPDPGNEEHYWGWTSSDMHAMLVEAGWNPKVHQSINFYDPAFIYNFQIWGCS